MHLYKISNKLHRLRNLDIVKDIWIGDKGQILKPINDYNILTESEMDFVMEKLINE